MNWAEAFASVFGGLFFMAFLAIILLGWPDIHIHRHYHNKRKDK